MASLSVVIPVLNEAAILERKLQTLRECLGTDNEIIVVDGGSEDASVSIAELFADKVLISPTPSRGAQMNLGASHCKGNYIVFLHADTILPDVLKLNFHHHMLSSQVYWGFFYVALDGRHCIFRMIERLINLRSRLSAVATGDQAIFVERKFFAEQRGFADIPLMEDVELCKRYRKHAKPFVVKQAVITSSRRWLNNGIAKTILVMWCIRLLYFLGVSPEKLAKVYR